MVGYLYINKSDKRDMNKSLEAVGNELDLEFKEDTTIINPTFILRTETKVLKANYIYVPDLNRYYFINDYTVSHQRIYINCHVDVLTSFASSIRKETVIVKRNTNLYNMYLDDNKYKVQNRTTTRTVVFPSGFTGHNIVLGVVGRNSE